MARKETQTVKVVMSFTLVSFFTILLQLSNTVVSSLYPSLLASEGTAAE